MHKIKFEMGDPSGDGHNISDSYIIRSNIDIDQLEAINKKVFKILGFEIRDIAGEYQEHSIRPDILSVLIRLGIITKDDEIYKELLDLYKEYKTEIDDSLEGEKLDLTSTDHIQIIYDSMEYKSLDGLEPATLLYLWLDIFKYIEPGFLYEVDKLNSIPTISSHIGYGLYI